MNTMDRRKFLVAALCGAGAGLALAPLAASALPLDAGAAGRLAGEMNDDVERAQVVIVNGRPRRRRWVCWWRRGRRVCGWRWV
ncbi:hypothetical protein DFR50_115102 [Roseiarcus fermentans]|uniref:Secreted protein n=1 Tax=Roseiarcus fermentans TaxID=1473586 RepID=A0A366FE46_9HYPH|nr:hypothetical protein [Roseiarcus fermentans]RBP11995.1 hypothetical protein DFR50_115102 [Roseiarcus fermentans]